MGANAGPIAAAICSGRQRKLFCIADCLPKSRGRSRQPTWTTAATLRAGSKRRTGKQSATRMPIMMPGWSAMMASHSTPTRKWERSGLGSSINKDIGAVHLLRSQQKVGADIEGSGQGNVRFAPTLCRGSSVL
jgi:hypothetical protein